MKIYRLDELEGSCYIEVLPGPYRNRCWNVDSIYMDEETFGYLESAVEKEYEPYDHYAFNELDAEIWRRIVNRLEETLIFLKGRPQAEELKEHIGFIFTSSETDFIEALEENMDQLIRLMQEFVDWITLQLQNHKVISILGI
ncbi:hypothetical protein ABER23_04370 [Paenibacillus lautus]|uniref:hypothetical protein n=1 Tax=Paenibacillus lautus TaxID=1401 RepID=UPI003D2DD908